MKFKLILPYLCLFFVAAFLFLFLRFPGGQIAGYVESRLTAFQPGITVNIDELRPSLPFNLKFHGLVLQLPENRIITPESFMVQIPPWHLLADPKKVKFKAEIYNGTVKGTADIGSFSPVAYSSANIVLDGIKIEKLGYRTPQAEILLDAVVSGEYHAPPKGLQKDSGEPKNEGGQIKSGQGHVEFRDVTAEVKNELFLSLNLHRIQFSSATVEFTRRNRTVNIVKFNADGNVVNVRMKGKILLATALENSRLSLTGIILPDSPYLAKFANSDVFRAVAKNIKKSGIRFTIKGTLNQPELKI